jgi:nucleoside-diphosphate-sugar epimerase
MISAGGTEDELERISSHFRGRTVLVTGAFGFIGTALVRRLSAADADLRLLRRGPRAGSGPGCLTAILGDVTERETWERVLPGVDTVFHLAGQTSTKASDRDPELDFRVNAVATWTMLDVCRRLGGRPTVLLAGTQTQVGVPPALPLRGNEPDRPVSFYDLHKLMAEEALELHARRGIVRGTTLRLPTVYGAGGQEGSPDCGMLNAMIRKALSGGPLTIYGTGKRLRDFVEVDDIARAFLLAAGSIERCSARHFNVGSAASCTVEDAVHLVAKEVERVVGRAIPVVHVDEPEDESVVTKASFHADLEPLERQTGWRPLRRLSEGIAETVRAFRAAVVGE